MRVAFGSRARYVQVLNWAKGLTSTLPPSFSAHIAKDGTMFSTVMGVVSLPFAPVRPGMHELRFSEREGSRLAHILDGGGRFVRNLELTASGETLPLKELSWWMLPHGEAMAQGQVIREWVTNDGPLPPEKRANTTHMGGISFAHVEGRQLMIRSLGQGQREVIIRFSDADGEKRLSIYEADGSSLINEFKIARNEQGVFAVITLEPSSQQESNIYNESLRKWLLEGDSPPPDRLRYAYKGAIILGKVEENRISLFGLGGGQKNKVLLRFKDFKGKKRLEAYSADGKTLLNTYRLERNNGIWQANPLKLSQKKQALVRGREIRRWLLEGGQIPAGGKIKIQKNGGACLLLVEGDRITLTGIGNSERDVMVSYSENVAGNGAAEKVVDVFEADGKTHIKSFALGKGKKGKWSARPLELSFQQKANFHSKKIKRWLGGEGAPPPERQGKISANGESLLCSWNGQAIRMAGLGKSKRAALVEYVENKGEKRVRVFEADGETLVREFRVEQDPDTNWRAVPLEPTAREMSKWHGDMIRRWLSQDAEVPPARERSLKTGLGFALCLLNGRSVFLRGLAGRRRKITEKFIEVGDEKRVEIYEASGELANAYLLKKGDKVFYEPIELRDEIQRQKLAELEKLIDEGRHRALLENLPADLRIDFLLMLYSQKFGEDILLELSERVERKQRVLDGVPASANVQRNVAGGKGGEDLRLNGRQEPRLDQLESALVAAVFKKEGLEGILSIVQEKYLHELLSAHTFDIAAAREHARRKAAELEGEGTLLYWAARAAVERLDRRFAVSGLNAKIKLRAHQRLGVQFLLDHPQALLADEMGSGKTLQAVMVAVNSGCQKVVIICRPSGRRIWKKEVRRKLARGEDRSYVVVRSARGLKKARKKRFVIINYEYARGHVKEIQELNPDMIILDEAHALCHEDSQQSHRIRDLKAPRKIAMTGTPILNEAKELWPILYFLLPEEFPASEGFVRNYASNMYQRALLHNRLRGLMLRRKMGDYRVEMPPLVEESVEVEMTAEQRRVYQEIAEDPMRWAHAHGRKYSRLRLVAWLLHAADDLALLKLGEAGEGGKYAKVAELIGAAPEKQRLIFVHNRIPVKYLSQTLPAARAIMMETSQKERDEIIEDYKAGRIKTIIMSYKIGGESYNLPETDEIILFDQPWNTPQRMQAIYRGYRLDRGKERELRVISLISKDTIDVDMVSLQRNKWQDFREVVEGAKDRRHLTEQNMERLLAMSQRRRLMRTMAEEYMEEMPEELRTAEFYRAIGRGDFEAIARYYKEHLEELKSFWSAIARIGMMREMGLEEWQDELSLGAGPSTVYEAWGRLNDLKIVAVAPKVVDVDQSAAMNEAGENPHKHQISMAEIAGIEGEFDVVGAEFSFYYVDPIERAEVIRQAWYKLKEKGHLVLSGPRMVFEDEAIQAIEKLGFKVLTVPAAQMETSKLLLASAKALGKSEEEARALIRNTGILIARKTANEPSDENVYIPITKKAKEEDPEPPRLIETRLMDEAGRIYVAYLPENDPRLLQNR